MKKVLAVIGNKKTIATLREVIGKQRDFDDMVGSELHVDEFLEDGVFQLCHCSLVLNSRLADIKAGRPQSKIHLISDKKTYH